MKLCVVWKNAVQFPFKSNVLCLCRCTFLSLLINVNCMKLATIYLDRTLVQKIALWLFQSKWQTCQPLTLNSYSSHKQDFICSEDSCGHVGIDFHPTDLTVFSEQIINSKKRKKTKVHLDPTFTNIILRMTRYVWDTWICKTNKS